jgi:hypothetical protein
MNSRDFDPEILILFVNYSCDNLCWCGEISIKQFFNFVQTDCS